MQCNIDAKGKAVRLVIGLAFIAAGVLLLVFGGTEGVPLGVGIGCLAGGAFSTFEGWSGWCAIRAMGFRTRL
ncbi:MAG: hypothetical protein CMJ34_02530 [Phycisphaerae bacterium]|nr:hypothetical protein [Phycisphaerae bacterium]